MAMRPVIPRIVIVTELASQRRLMGSGGPAKSGSSPRDGCRHGNDSTMKLPLALVLAACRRVVGQARRGTSRAVRPGTRVLRGGEGAAYSTVEIAETNARQFAGADGRFAFVALPRGSYRLRVRQLGFAPSTR